MTFDSTKYGPEAAAILALDGGGSRLMPLAEGTCSSPEARDALRGLTVKTLFPASRAGDAALAGLYLYFSCRDEAHEIAQSVETPEGSFWHAIVHRQEPDASNSSYWFRRVGKHAIFPELRAQAAGSGVDFGPAWDPFAFIAFCEKARRTPGSEDERRAQEVQRIEWQLLFDYCARPA